MSLATSFRIFEYIVQRRNPSGEYFNPNVIFYLSCLSQLVVVIAAGLVYRRLGGEMRMLAVYFVIALIITAIQMVLALRGMNNLWTGQVFSPIEFIMLMYVFYRWNRNSSLGKIMLISIPTYIVAWLIGIVLLGNDIYAYLNPIGSASFVLASSFTLLTLDRDEISPVLGMPSFWVSSAASIYFGGTIVLYSLNTALLKASFPTLRLAWSVQAVINILANIVYAGGFLCLRRRT